MDANVPESETCNVSVQIFLVGGNKHDVILPSDSLILRDLFAAMAIKDSGAVPPIYFQIPLRDGRAVCSFSSSQLVSIIAEPPILLESTQPEPAEQPRPEPTVQPGYLYPAVYVQFDDFLTPDEHRQLLDYTMEHESKFIESSVTTDAVDYRKSFVLNEIGDSPWAALFRERVAVYLPFALHKFGRQAFPVGRVEVQLTAHNEGEYYKVHNDSGHDSTNLREISYVYYFHREPKRFTGGELVLYDSSNSIRDDARRESFRVVEPRNNRIVIFQSQAQHEIVPVSCPSRDFADGRFTVNGWIGRQDTNASPTDGDEAAAVDPSN